MSAKIISEEMLANLRESMKTKMSGSRFAHTRGVEEMAARIGAIYCPEKVNLLRAAALLHDMTKELSVTEHKKIIEKHGGTMSPEMESSPPTQHAMTAALEIPCRYPEFCDEEIIEAVKHHTTGKANMSLTEKIIYLSDYIDLTRTYSDCVALRDMFWGAEPAEMTEEERLIHLDRVILRSLEMTVADLVENGRSISSETIEAMDYLQEKLN